MGALKLVKEAVRNGKTGVIKGEFAESANLHVANSTYNSTNTSETDNNVDHYNMDGPAPASDDLAGRIRRIQCLIDQRQSVEAIALAVETLRVYADSPNTSLDKVYEKIEDSVTYLHLNGTQHEADLAKRIILENLNLSSRWGNNLIEHIGLDGFASVISALRSENTSDVNGPSMGVNRDSIPTLGYAA